MLLLLQGKNFKRACYILRSEDTERVKKDYNIYGWASGLFGSFELIHLLKLAENIFG